MTKYKKLIHEITIILEAVKGDLTERDVQFARDFLEHNEWGLAFSLICTQLYEYGVTINSEFYIQIENAGRQMSIPPEEWEMLRELIATI